LATKIDGITLPILASNLVGLIDTDADGCMIDERSAVAYKLKKLRDAPASFSGHQIPAEVFLVQLCFVKERYVAGLEIISAGFHAAGQQFDVILGMDFLRPFDIHVSPTNNLVELQFVG
jgi:hypothetical protein